MKIKDFFLLTLSAILTAMAVKLFFIEYVLTPGGITGLAIAFSFILNIEVDYISLAISIPLLVIATYILGKSFGIKTLYITITVPLFLKIIPLISITNSIVIAAICGGLLVGLSISLALYCKCATGGTDVIALLLKKMFKSIDLSIILFILDMIIVLLSMLISKDYFTSLYSIVSLLVIMVTIRGLNRVLKYD